MTTDTIRTEEPKHGDRKKVVYKANYGDATPEQVARAVLTFRPTAKAEQAPKTPPVQAD